MKGLIRVPNKSNKLYYTVRDYSEDLELGNGLLCNQCEFKNSFIKPEFGGKKCKILEAAEKFNDKHNVTISIKACGEFLPKVEDTKPLFPDLR